MMLHMVIHSEKVKEHFRDQRNIGVIEDTAGTGEAGSVKCSE